ncbi:hypothetical protein PRIPAC_82094, partial [Pristionchus pacificus]|uniref:G protein-coupled receptor n=1 Tax=Pristionchus pacificus TaxID=54126 RepID=A0A2A6CM77_PRIPA
VNKLQFPPDQPFVAFSLHRQRRCEICNNLLSDERFSGKEDIVIFAADMIKDQYLGYFISGLGSLSFERFIASKFWRWYERGSSLTLTVVIAVELIANVPSWINVALCEFDYIPHEANLVLFAGILMFSILLYAYSYRDNVRTLRSLSGRSGRYSVAHAFQVKENLSVLKFILIFMGSSLPMACLCFVFFIIFFFAPSEWDRERFLCMGLFDFTISLYAPIFIYVAVTSIREYHVQLYKICAFSAIAKWVGWKHPDERQLRGNVSRGDETTSYFSQFTQAWA